MLESIDSDQKISFLDEDEPEIAEQNRQTSWKVMIVDDEPAIHDVTLLALQDFTFADRTLEFIQCYSGAEAKQAIADNPDTALILLDVVMEDDHAGLEVARHIRETLGNKNVRIVLRTGQPGQAPERRVIADYDINDYKEKTELTSSKLYTLMYSSLRSFRDIETIEASKHGLARVIDALASISKLTSIKQFTNGVLDQLTALLRLNQGALYMSGNGLAANLDGDRYEIVAGTGSFETEIGRDARQVLDPNSIEYLNDARIKKANSYADNAFVGFFESALGNENFVFLSGIHEIGRLEKNLIEVFTRNVSIAFDNIHLHEDLEATQREIVYMLGEAVETRSQETGNHVKRVAEISKLLALDIGLDIEEAEIIKFASPLHDLGKISIPDAILNKPGPHTPEEREIMKTHAEIGHKMLCGSKRRILQAGAIIANEHHERWDGDGYPNRKAGEDIHIYGRITAVADVFDAVGSHRCYKEAWPLDKVLALFREETGRHFDPSLVDSLFSNLDQIGKIQARFPDHTAS